MALASETTSAKLFKWLIRIGLVLILVPGLFAAAHWSRLYRMTQQSARVSEIRQGESPSGQIVATPHIIFLVAGSQRNIIDFVVHPGPLTTELIPGRTVNVAYPHGKPNAAELATTSSVYGVDIAFATLGMLIFDLGYGLWYRRRHRERYPDTQPPLRERGFGRHP